MAIYTFIQGLSAGSDLSAPLNSDWFRVSSLSWGASQGVAGILEDVVLGRQPDAISPSLANRAITGAPLGVVLIAITEPDGKKCASGFKLDGAHINSWGTTTDANGATQERLTLGYRKIAQAMLIAGQLQLTTWDRGTNTPWNDAARSFYLDPRMGIRLR